MQLISYIALGAPATRKPASGLYPYLRPEIGFTPKWFHEALGIDFGEKWHSDLCYRREKILLMRTEVDRRFPDNKIGKIDEGSNVLDMLTGLNGTCTIASMYGIPIRYNSEQWPTSEHCYLSDERLRILSPIKPENNLFFMSILNQVDTITAMEGKCVGFINWQGVLNNAQRLRGQQLFTDMLIDPEMTINLLECVTSTMIEAARLLQNHQLLGGVNYSFFTVSNCLVNMISQELYHELILPFDKRIAAAFDSFGIHNCAWNANPYLEDYATIPGVGYIDMGMESDLKKARILFPDSRRSLMYTPMDVKGKPITQIRKDLEYIASQYGPCDIVAADIEYDTPDTRVMDFIKICREISDRYD